MALGLRYVPAGGDGIVPVIGVFSVFALLSGFFY